ncbi:MAG TPA: ABC transporter ATP-binding protein [Candidatus Binatia bacterium]|jgi:lipoprotein-releasing system ATP-binding protein
MSDAAAAKSVPAIEADGLERRYDDKRKVIEVLKGVCLAVAAGESLAVIGESGTGKSTLLHLLGGLDRPDGGTVKVGGIDLYGLAARERTALRGKDIGFVFQFHHLLGDFDALENVMMPLLVTGSSRSAARKRALAILERVGLGHRLDHRPGELSGGEQQRVAVARALAAHPSVVLADEPTGNLDPGTAEEVHRLLRDVQKEEGAALIVATHNSTLAGMLDRTLRMENGVLKEGRWS